MNNFLTDLLADAPWPAALTVVLLIVVLLIVVGWLVHALRPVLLRVLRAERRRWANVRQLVGQHAPDVIEALPPLVRELREPDPPGADPGPGPPGLPGPARGDPPDAATGG